MMGARTLSAILVLISLTVLVSCDGGNGNAPPTEPSPATILPDTSEVTSEETAPVPEESPVVQPLAEELPVSEPVTGSPPVTEPVEEELPPPIEPEEKERIIEQFVAICEKPSEGAYNTVQRLLRPLQTYDCREAAEKLAASTTLHVLESVGDPGLTNLDPIKVLTHLTSLSIRNQGINSIDTIMPLTALERLETLDLSGNQLTHFGLGGFFPNLKVLKLDNNQISSLDDFAHFKNLQYLSLHRNELTDLDLTVALSPLTDLILTNNQIATIVPPASPESIHITHLHLNGNQITDLSSLVLVAGLGELSVSENALPDAAFVPLTTIPTLRALSIGGNPIKNPYSVVTELRKSNEQLTITLPTIDTAQPIETLDRIGTIAGRFVTDWCEKEGVGEPETLTIKKIVDSTEGEGCYWSAVSVVQSNTLNLNFSEGQEYKVNKLAPVSVFTNLTQLSLESNEIIDINELAVLSPLTDLRVLNLRYNALNSIAGLSTWFPKLEDLNLGGCALGTGESAATLDFSSFANLTYLNLNTNAIPNMETIKALPPQLKTFILNNNPIPQITVAHTVNFPLIENLYLESCGLTNIDGVFSKIASIKRLNLRKNQLPEAQINYWTNQEGLEELDVSENPGLTPAAIGTLLNSETLKKKTELVVATTPEQWQQTRDIISNFDSRWCNNPQITPEARLIVDAVLELEGGTEKSCRLAANRIAFTKRIDFPAKDYGMADFSPLKEFTNATYIDFDVIQLRNLNSLEPLKALTEVTEVHLSNLKETDFTGIERLAEWFPKLQVLWIACNDFAKRETLPQFQFGAFSNLNTLSFYGNDLNNLDMAASWPPALKSLALHGNKVTLEQVKAIPVLPQLTHLWVSRDPSFTEAAHAEIKAMAPEINLFLEE